MNGPHFLVKATRLHDSADALALTFEGKEGTDLIGIDVIVPAPTLTEDMTDYLTRLGASFYMAARKIAVDFYGEPVEVVEDEEVPSA